MFADIFADKSDNIFLDPRRYIRRHDICNIAKNQAPEAFNEPKIKSELSELGLI